MKNTMRILAAALVVMVAILCFGCGKKTEEKVEPAQATQTVEPAETQTPENAQTTETTTAQPTSAPAAEPDVESTTPAPTHENMTDLA